MSEPTDLTDRMIPRTLVRSDQAPVYEKIETTYGISFAVYELDEEEQHLVRQLLDEVRLAGRPTDDYAKDQIRKAMLLGRVQHAAIQALNQMRDDDPDRATLDTFARRMISRRLDILRELGLSDL